MNDYDIDRELATYREDVPDYEGYQEWYETMVAPHERDSLPSDFGLCDSGEHAEGSCDCGVTYDDGEPPF